MHVGDHGALRPEALDPRERVSDAEMAGMRCVAQTVEDPEVEVFERAPAFAGDVANIRRIGSVSNAIAERRDVAVLRDESGQRHRAALSKNLLALAGFDSMPRQDR